MTTDIQLTQCAKCGISFEQNTGSYKKRFCSRKCANSRIFTEETNRKRSKSLKKTFKENPKRLVRFAKKSAEARKKNHIERFMEAKFDELPLGTKKRRVLHEQNYECNACRISTWQDKVLTLELDHIDGDNSNNDRSNLRYLCPNCHAQTPTWRGRKNKREMQ